jgi:histone deacetylase 1/2
VETNWYSATGATDPITRELSKISTHEKYNGRDRVKTTNVNGLQIKHIGHSTLRTPNSSLHLNNILHVPSDSKNLLSICKLALDNHVFIEFHALFFLIKDLATRKIFFKGPCHAGLYPLVPFSIGSSLSKHAYLTTKPTSSTWH